MNTAEAYIHETPAYPELVKANSDLAKEIRYRLNSKLTGKASVLAHYTGRGIFAHRRQILVRLESGQWTDLWIENGRIDIGRIFKSGWAARKAPRGTVRTVTITGNPRPTENILADIAQIINRALARS
jgi:hypothetical protein